jgi:hypothetical protein
LLNIFIDAASIRFKFLPSTYPKYHVNADAVAMVTEFAIVPDRRNVTSAEVFEEGRI